MACARAFIAKPGAGSVRCFPESVLPFSDKGSEEAPHFCGIMAALLYEE